eukprot:CAMPEP_0167778062 /NCGR_PEP_ID=MMETSP0111_2-20121227/4047_1 /TAXON_ID=91324 /ORGANISM="Lotharella globosa, Strain CCCM811" /LENGTH=96 /DNA_ID=CAMNT_0007668329 /DNA_START=680 /DNA_END=970 /DNA_ORIENTATION=+
MATPAAVLSARVVVALILLEVFHLDVSVDDVVIAGLPPEEFLNLVADIQTTEITARAKQAHGKRYDDHEHDHAYDDSGQLAPVELTGTIATVVVVK